MYLIVTTSQMILNSKMFNVFKEVCSPSLYLFNPNYSKIVKYLYYLQ